MGQERVAELRRVRDAISGEREWEFACECGRRDCDELVFLTLDAYAALHDAGQAVLAEGHRVSQVARARRLVQAARALSAQAEQQVARARRNLRKP
jgi:multidrug efflux pump subunit AcrA (membrane-fusion protein)